VRSPYNASSSTKASGDPLAAQLAGLQVEPLLQAVFRVNIPFASFRSLVIHAAASGEKGCLLTGKAQADGHTGQGQAKLLQVGVISLREIRRTLCDVKIARRPCARLEGLVRSGQIRKDRRGSAR
jgi:hypothetical protein